MGWLKIIKFFRLSWQSKLLLLATLAIALYSGVLFSFFKKKARFVNGPLYGEGSGVSDAQLKKIIEIRWSITTVSKITCWKNVCRHQAYQAVMLLRYFCIPYQVFVGFKKDGEGVTVGHVWTMAGQQIITGSCVPDEYVVFSKHEG